MLIASPPVAAAAVNVYHTKLHTLEAWDELNEEQQERIEQPLKSRSDATVSSNTTIPFLRSVESRIRIVWDMAQDRIPEDPDERSRLARRRAGNGQFMARNKRCHGAPSKAHIRRHRGFLHHRGVRASAGL